MFMHSLISICVGAASAAFAAGCAVAGPKPSEPLRVLETELRTNTGWIQVHAADALLDHGKASVVLEVLNPAAAAPPEKFRTGIWRTLARAEHQAKGSTEHINRLLTVLEDPAAPDRLQAAESLAKLGHDLGEKRAVLEVWLKKAPAEIAPYLYWLLLLGTDGDERASLEKTIAGYLESKDVIARARAAYALSRLDVVSSNSLSALSKRSRIEPVGSIARPYLFSALLRHSKQPPDLEKARQELRTYLRQGSPDQKLEAGTVLGLRREARAKPDLDEVLRDPEADARVGAASGLMYLMR